MQSLPIQNRKAMIDETRYRTHLIYIAIILALITGVFFWGKHEGVVKQRMKNENQWLFDRVKALEAERDTATAKATHEEQKRTKVILTAQSEQTSLKAQVSFWKKRVQSADKIARVQPTPIESSDSTQFSYPCSERDSVIEIQDRLVMSLDKEITDVSESFTRELKFKDDQLGAQKAISELWEKSAVSQRHEVVVQTRWKKFWRGTAVVLGVAAVTEAVIIGAHQ